MTADITNAQISPDRIFPISTDIGNAELHFSRDFNFNEQTPKEECLIFIPRNPISICISAYYSFGYTHRCPFNSTEHEFSLKRKKIQEMGLQRFVEKYINRECNYVKNILHSNYDNKTVIPYELMIDNFNAFLSKYLSSINMSSRHEFIYSRWNKEFNPIKDQSDLIESGSIKTHKRTTDIYEWKTKLNQSVLENILAKHEIINEYIELLAIYNL
jgi:hypothetical protein